VEKLLFKICCFAIINISHGNDKAKQSNTRQAGKMPIATNHTPSGPLPRIKNMLFLSLTQGSISFPFKICYNISKISN